MVKIPGMYEENEQYELIPAEKDHWHIRIMEGDFIESVISFGAIRIKKDDHINFDFSLHSSQIEDLTVDNIDLQRYAGKILESIMINNLNAMDTKS